MKNFFSIISFLVLTMLTAPLFGQQSPVVIKRIPVKHKAVVKDTIRIDTLAIKPKVPLAEQKDIGDVLTELFHSKPTPVVDSITSKPEISIAPAIGYTLLSRFALVLSGNAIFKTGPQSRISTIIASTSYTQNKQFTLPIQTNIWSKDNTFNFLGEYVYYKYPQSTYGLGSNSNIKNDDPMDYSYFKFYQTALRRVTGDLYLGLGFIFNSHWNVSDKGVIQDKKGTQNGDDGHQDKTYSGYNIDGTPDDYSVYGKRSHSVASGLTFNLVLDSRDNGINPMKGGYAALQYRDNYEFLGSTIPWRSLILDVRKYIRFPENSDNVLALWNYDWFVLSGRPEYLDLPSTQWDGNTATGRGYIQGRFRGAQMIYAEAEYRFKITHNGLLGGVVFINGQSFSAAPRTGLQRIQPGYGPGLRLKLNKTSNTNITIDYGFGRQGSNGLFIDIGEAF